MLAVLAFINFPFATLHHHKHENVCDVASAIPSKFKKEKDHSKHHIHTFEESCFACDSIIYNSNYVNQFDAYQFKKVEHSLKFFFLEFYFFNSIQLNKNKAPPVFAA